MRKCSFGAVGSLSDANEVQLFVFSKKQYSHVLLQTSESDAILKLFSKPIVETSG